MGQARKVDNEEEASVVGGVGEVDRLSMSSEKAFAYSKKDGERRSS